MRYRPVVSRLVLLWVALTLTSCIAIKREFRRDASADIPDPYTVVPKFYGVELIAERRLLRLIEDYMLDLSRLPDREATAVDAELDIIDFYRSSGFPDVEVAHRFERDDEKRRLVVVFEIGEGPEVTTEMTIVGNEALDTADLMRFWVRTNAGRLGLGDPLFVESDITSFAESLRIHYRTQGFFDVEVDKPVIEREPGSDVARARIELREGIPYRVGTIDIGEEIEAALAAGVADRIREVSERLASAAAIEETRRVAIADLRRDGYYEASVHVHVTPRAPDHRVDVRLFGDPGPRGRIEELVVEGNEQTLDWFIDGLFEFEIGEWYDESKIDKTRREMFLTGLFHGVNIDHEVIDDDPSRLRLVVRIEEEESRSVDVLAGWGSYERARGLVRFAENNVFGTGRRFAVEGRASTRGARGAVTITDPYLLGTKTRLTLGADIFEREEPSFTDKARGVTAAFARDLGGGLKARVGYAYRERDNSETDIDSDLDNFTQGNVFTEFKLDHRDSVLYPRRGFLLEAQFDKDDPSFGSDVEFERARFSASAYVPIYRDIHVALRGSTGALWPGETSDRVPLQERFFNGGENSVRSFRESRLGPRDANGTLVGGEFRNLFTAEVRVPGPGLFEAALFADAGNVGSTVEEYGLSNLRYAVGAGVRLQLPIGPIRVDGAFNPDRNPGESEWVVHLSVGYPF